MWAATRSQALLVCALASLMLASAFPVPSHRDEDPHEGQPLACAPLDHWHVCALYVAKSEGFDGPYHEWQPEPLYHSLCCALVRDESEDCICQASTTKYSHLEIDLDRAMNLPNWCSKKVAQGTKCSGKEMQGHDHEEVQPYFGAHGASIGYQMRDVEKFRKRVPRFPKRLGPLV